MLKNWRIQKSFVIVFSSVKSAKSVCVRVRGYNIKRNFRWIVLAEVFHIGFYGSFWHKMGGIWGKNGPFLGSGVVMCLQGVGKGCKNRKSVCAYAGAYNIISVFEGAYSGGVFVLKRVQWGMCTVVYINGGLYRGIKKAHRTVEDTMRRNMKVGKEELPAMRRALPMLRLPCCVCRRRRMI